MRTCPCVPLFVHTNTRLTHLDTPNVGVKCMTLHIRGFAPPDASDPQMPLLQAAPLAQVAPIAQLVKGRLLRVKQKQDKAPPPRNPLPGLPRTACSTSRMTSGWGGASASRRAASVSNARRGNGTGGKGSQNEAGVLRTMRSREKQGF